MGLGGAAGEMLWCMSGDDGGDGAGAAADETEAKEDEEWLGDADKGAEGGGPRWGDGGPAVEMGRAGLPDWTLE